MKKCCLTSILIILFGLQACVVDEAFFFNLNNEEIIQVNPDGSGTYSLRFDLNDFLGEVLAGREDREMEIYKSIAIDSTIRFNESLSGVSDVLTENERAMFKDGSVKFVINISQKKGLILTKLNFQNVAQLAFERDHVLEFVKNNILNATKLLLSREGSQLPKHANFDFRVESRGHDNIDAELPITDAVRDLKKVFNVHMSGEKIENKLIDLQVFEKKISGAASLKSMKNDEYLKGIFLKTTYVLPRPIKNSRGSIESISADKKIITFKNSLFELLNEPGLLEYLIEYPILK